jgi:hypothetical protein
VGNGRYDTIYGVFRINPYQTTNHSSADFLKVRPCPIGDPAFPSNRASSAESRACGMRISVADVLEYLAADISIEEILSDFPYLGREDILACLAYAAERERERGAAPQSA